MVLGLSVVVTDMSVAKSHQTAWWAAHTHSQFPLKHNVFGNATLGGKDMDGCWTRQGLGPRDRGDVHISLTC